MTGAQGPAGVQSPLQGLAHGELSMCGLLVSLCACGVTVDSQRRRFTVDVVGADNSIRVETDLEAE